jgi:hypothetical protein
MMINKSISLILATLAVVPFGSVDSAERQQQQQQNKNNKPNTDEDTRRQLRRTNKDRRERTLGDTTVNTKRGGYYGADGGGKYDQN